MDKVHMVVLLLDFYGQLLTRRQYEIMDYHFNQDYSLSEISEQFGISRQGVHDSIKKGKIALERYENKLMLVDKFLNQQEVVKQIMKEMETLDDWEVGKSEKILLNNIKNKLAVLLND